MQIDQTSLPGVLILTPRRFGDSRGWFMETFSATRMAEAGLTMPWVQDNQSFSAAKGTLRGPALPAPAAGAGQAGALFARGTILDVAVDFRDGSPTFAQMGGGGTCRPRTGASCWCPRASCMASSP
jgi:dTDP-4-dehydrorhamnose 3,5-epimerase